MYSASMYTIERPAVEAVVSVSSPQARAESMAYLESPRAEAVDALVDEMDRKALTCLRMARRTRAMVRSVKTRQHSAWMCGHGPR